MSTRMALWTMFLYLAFPKCTRKAGPAWWKVTGYIEGPAVWLFGDSRVRVWLPFS